MVLGVSFAELNLGGEMWFKDDISARESHYRICSGYDSFDVKDR